jgi:hypothetical protein
MNVMKASRGRIVSILFGMIAILFLVRCKKEPDYAAMQKEYLEKKMDNYKAFQERNCNKRILKEARANADSFFLSLAKEKDFDSVQRPSSFARPQKPNVTVREDSLPLQPLIENEVIDSIPVDSIETK